MSGKGFADLLSQTRKRSKQQKGDRKIQAAGRAISGKNAETLRSGLSAINDGRRQIAEVLLAAEAIDPEYLEASGAGLSVEASAFTDAVYSRSWFAQFRTLLRMFQYRFEYLNLLPLSALKEYVDESFRAEGDRDAAIVSLVDDFNGTLRQISQTYPEMGNEAYSYEGYYDYYDEELYMSAREGEPEKLLEASAFTHEYAVSSWSTFFHQLVREFKRRFEMLHSAKLKSLKLDNEEERQSAIAELLQEMAEMLSELVAQSAAFRSEEVEVVNASASAASGEKRRVSLGEVFQGYRKGLKGLTPQYLEGQEIQAASIALEGDISISANIVSAQSAGVEIEAAQASNLHPIKGVLFKVDEPSESAPSVGPALPLYIPREVAEAVLNVENMPLEAAVGLSAHDREGTCGVMNTAEISGNDFSVNGFVWPYNHSERVSQILAAKDLLGMSMNALADGHIAFAAGKKVFWIDRLELLGGCILFADKATYQQTKLAASKQLKDSSLSEGRLVAASAVSTPSNEKGEEAMDSAVKSQFDDLANSIKAMADGLSDQIKSVNSSVGDMNARLQTLEAARNQELEAAARQQQIEAAQTQRDQLVAAMGEALGKQLQDVKDAIPEMISAQVRQAINPRGAPTRRTAPLAGHAVSASGGSPEWTTENHNSTIQNQLARLDGLIEGSRDNLAQQLKYKDERRQLESQLLPMGS